MKNLKMDLWRRLRRDERGATMIMVAVTIVVSIGFAVVAIDVSKMLLAKTQLQNAADAAALSAAIAFEMSGGNAAVATAEAITVSGLNSAVQVTRQPVSIQGVDVTFPGGDMVRVQTHRTQATGDPVALQFLRVLDGSSNNLGDVTAHATAQVFPVTGTACFKPWAVPDRWDDADGDTIYDPGEFYDPEITGYRVPDDVGDQIILKYRSAQASAPPKQGWFFPICFGPINTGDPVETGGNVYRQWIPGCEEYIVAIGDFLMIEPGGMMGPTDQGVDELFNSDPTAEWDPVTGTVINSAHATSPRIIRLAAYDPTLGTRTDLNGRPYVTVSKLLIVFLEATGDKGDITGRFVRHVADGEICRDCEPGFAFKPILIE